MATIVNGGVSGTGSIVPTGAGVSSPVYTPPPVPMGGGYGQMGSQTPPSTAPTMTAKFTPAQSGNITAPAVVTSQPAEDHIQNMQNTVDTAHADVQSNAAYNAAQAAAAATPPTKTGSTDNTAPPTGAGATGGAAAATDTSKPGTTSTTPPTVEDQINDIMSSLGTAEGTSATPSADQQNELDAATTMLGADRTAQDQVGQALDSLASGTMPLTPSEQAQVNSLQDSYKSALQAAIQYSKNLEGGAIANSAATGLQQYSPAMAMSNISSAINTGASKVSALNNKILSSMSKLTVTLQNADYRQATTLYDKISKDITDRVNEIDKINTAVQNETDKMHTQALDVAKLQIGTLTKMAGSDATAAYRAQQLILSTQRLTDAERKTAFDELNTANGTRTATERSANALSAFGEKFVPGAKMSDGTPTVDDHGYINPIAFKAAIADAPAEGLTRTAFIKEFGSMVYNDSKNGIDGRAYGLTPAEVKIITGALPK